MFSYVLIKKSVAKAELVKALLSTKIEFKNADKSEISEVSDTIVQQIENYFNVLKGNTQQVRFSPRLIRMCLLLWLNLPLDYDQFQKLLLNMYPSESSLKKIKKKVKVNEGIFWKL